MQYIYNVTPRDYTHNLFSHVLYSRQPIFIYRIRSKGVDLICQRGPSWVGIKIVILLYKVHSKPAKNEKKCLSKRLFRSTQTFSDYKPGVNLNENRYLPGLLMSYSRLFHAKA